MASKFEVEVEMKSGAEKVWNSIRESTTIFPKALPQHFQSIQVLEGDGKSVGSIRLVSYPPGLSEIEGAGIGLSEISSVKEKIEAVDEGAKSMKYSVIEGEILKYYKNFKGGSSVSSSTKGENGSSVKWSCEFDKATQETPNPDFIKDFAIKTFQDLDAYLLAN